MLDSTTIAWLLGFLNAPQQDALTVAATAALVVAFVVAFVVGVGKELQYIPDGKAGQWSTGINAVLATLTVILTALDPSLDIQGIGGAVAVVGSGILQLVVMLGTTKAAYLFLRWIGVAYSHPNGLPVTGPMPHALPTRPSNGNRDAL